MLPGVLQAERLLAVRVVRPLHQPSARLACRTGKNIVSHRQSGLYKYTEITLMWNNINDCCVCCVMFISLVAGMVLFCLFED